MDLELLERALTALNNCVPYFLDDGIAIAELKKEIAFRVKQLRVQAEFYEMPKETRDKMRMAQRMNWYARNDETTRKFEEAKKLVAKGMSIRQASIEVGMWPATYSKRAKAEKRDSED